MPKQKKEIDSKQKTLLLARLAQEKKAENVLILDLRDFSQITDFFIIASGSSTRKVRAIAEHVLKKSPFPLGHREGYAEGLWVLLDFKSVVCHFFYSQTRNFYRLEKLWADAPAYHLEDEKN